jgi:non-specific serine/threonine protein kinase
VLRETIDRIRLVGHLAQALRPPGYDPEAVYLVAVLQNLGWLLLRYHFADEAEQIRQLMQPAAAARGDGDPPAAEQPGLDQDAAAYAVLGVDIESFASAAARQWGLGAEVMHMIRRLPVDAPVRKPDNDNEWLRIVASAANEAIDALDLPTPKDAAALAEVVSRYARTLRLTTRILDDALDDARAALRGDGALASLGRAGIEEPGSGTDSRGAAAQAPIAATATALDRDQDG